MEVGQGPRRQDSRCPGGWRGQEGRRGPGVGPLPHAGWGTDTHRPVFSCLLPSLGLPLPAFPLGTSVADLPLALFIATSLKA